MKKKALLTSILTVVLCLCLIAGSTFALFTSNDQFDISVTSGKVNIDASATIAQLWSANGPVAAHNNKYLKDENGAYYEHIKVSEFTNGGTATIINGVVKIDKITPGDKVDFTVEIDNQSNVAINYRYKIVVNSGDKLASGMVLTADNVSTEGVYSYTSAWVKAEKSAPIASKGFSIELPVYAGNEYQDLSTEYTVIVEAVQFNGVVADEAEVVKYNVQKFDNPASSSANSGLTPTGGEINGAIVSGDTDDNGRGFRALYITALTEDLYVNDSYFEGTYSMNVNASNITNYGIYATGCTFNGWASYGSAKEVVFTDCSFGEAEGYANIRPYADTTFAGCDFVDGFTITCNSKTSNFSIDLTDCTVGGVKVTAANFLTLLGGESNTNSLHGSTIVVTVDGVAVTL